MSQAARRNLTFTHGVAAKLINNCYMKSRFVCGRYLRDGPGGGSTRRSPRWGHG